MKLKKQIFIIGGGAAGFFAAINCAEANPQAAVTILERGKSVLGKVKISGGGRCNVTHACFEARPLTKFYPRGEKALLGPFHTFGSRDTVEWFERKGVQLKAESDGRMFPVSNNSQTIVDCLIGAAQKAGVKIKTGVRVSDFYVNKKVSNQWIIEAGKDTYHADRLMIATGSNPKIWNILKKLSHTIIKPVPSLFTFHIKDSRIENLAGVSVPHAQVKVIGTKLMAQGPLLVTHWGMSGPAILKLSAWGARILNEKGYSFQIHVNWLGEMKQAVVLEDLKKWKQEFAARLVLKYPQYRLPKRLWVKLLEASGIEGTRKWADLSKKQMNKLTHELTQGEYTVRGKSTFKEEFVTAGGVDLKELNFKSFASKKLPHLYLAGEVLNIDAITGGFNFQAAWTGGYMAGKAMAE